MHTIIVTTQGDTAIITNVYLNKDVRNGIKAIAKRWFPDAKKIKLIDSNNQMRSLMNKFHEAQFEVEYEIDGEMDYIDITASHASFIINIDSSERV